MASRSNAGVELVRLWLQVRHKCLIDESVPVPVPYALSDIDLMAVRPDLTQFQLPNGVWVGPRLIVETKDEHDWDRSGREFGQSLIQDVEKMAGAKFVPKGTRGIKFTMLRQQHFEVASDRFGTEDFDRVFVVHALELNDQASVLDALANLRVHWLTIPDVVRDLMYWYKAHPRPAALRTSLTGDLFHLLVGFCGLALPTSANSANG